MKPTKLPMIVALACGMAIGSPAAADIEYTYDDLGRVVRVFDPAGADVTYAYDRAGIKPDSDELPANCGHVQ